MGICIQHRKNTRERERGEEKEIPNDNPANLQQQQ